MAGKRGILLSLSQRSLELNIAALEYLVEKPHLDELEEERDKIGRLARHLKEKLSDALRR